MQFSELLNVASSPASPGICIDSRLVKAGDIFIAIPGTIHDGRDFIDQALKNGAKYIVCQNPDARDKIPDAKYELIAVENPSEAAAILAQAANNNPAQRLTNLAVTGTNGKTTVAFLVRSIIAAAGQKCGLISTITYDTTETAVPAPLTTPDCLTIADQQAQMLTAGAKYMAIEASSHALSQHRLAAIPFKAAAFTNLTNDHLDYHKTKSDYLAAKTMLFESLPPNATAVLNKQSPHGEKIAEKTKAKILWYAIDTPADITAHIESTDINGTVFTLHFADQQQKINTPQLGRYNISNCLAAAGLCLAAGFDLPTIAAGISALKAIPGRLEKIQANDFTIIVDYAHTDDALKNVLETLRPLCKARLIVVFGCGGDRDKTKRTLMAATAEQLADFVIVTSDNPRTEHPAAIVGEIMTGFENPVDEKITHQIEREQAIELAIETACKDDIVLIAGKGHETYQIIGAERIDFDDRQVARRYLRKQK